MAGKNQVDLVFAGDSGQLEQAFDRVGAASDRMGSQVDDATASFDRSGEAAGRVDDQFGGMESGLQGTQDVMSGLSDISKGELLPGLTDLAGGVSGLALGFKDALVPALASSVTWLKATRVGILAQAAAGKVASAATKVWTGIQAAFNFVMALNPIVLVTIAVVALVAIIVIAYKRSDTFRRIVDGAFRGVLRGARAMVGWFRANFPPLARALAAPFVAAFRAIRAAWNATVGGRGFTVPDWIPGLGGRSFTIPRFHLGGIMPGAPGTEGLALLQAGERVTPASQSSPVRITVERGSGTSTDQALAGLFLGLIRTGALRLAVRDNAVVVAGG
jgi:hypothetical protein